MIRETDFFIRETKLGIIHLLQKKIANFHRFTRNKREIKISISRLEIMISESFAICKYLIKRGFSNLSMIKIIYRIETKVVRVYQKLSIQRESDKGLPISNG